MRHISKNCGAVILCGGTSRRMGKRKAELVLGGASMLERTYACLTGFDEVVLSVGADVPERLPGVRRIPDVFPGCGPLAGIHATLLATEKEALFYVPCDLPYFCAELPQSLLEHMPLHAEAFVCRDSTGRIHPLCGIYRKSVLPLLESELKSGLYSVMRFLQKLEYCCLDTAQLLPDSIFLNMNTPDTYRKVCEE